MADAIIEMMDNLLEEKNKLYGDAFHKVWEEYGLTAVNVILSIKLSRLKNLATQKEDIALLHIRDTLLDIMGYSALALNELKGKSLERRKHMLTEPDQHI